MKKLLKKGKKTGFFLVFMLLWCVQPGTPFGYVFGQQVTVSGTVVDETNDPLAGVNVVVAGTTNGTITDFNGRFTLSVPSGNVKLIISCIGFVTKEQNTNGLTTMHITLQEDINLIEEVVVIGYGKANRKDITGAVSTLKSTDMNVGVFSSPAQMLQGKVPGLSVTRSGNPSESSSIVLRGQSTLREGGAMEPFYVIDGVPGASIDLVSPDDIVSIDILRDASSTAIYGSRAANGVIMVTTKRPQDEQGYLTYSGYIAIDRVSNRLKMMTGDELRSFTNNTLRPDVDDFTGVNTNWQDEVQRTGFSNNHNVSFGGSGKATTYSASINYLNNQGIIRTTGLERYILRANIEQKLIGNHVIVGLNLSESNTKQSWVPDELLQNMLTFLPTMPIRDMNGDYSENFQRTGGYGNPVAMLENDPDKRKYAVSLGNAYININILPGLVYNFSYSIQNFQNSRDTYNSSKSTIRKGTNGYAIRNTYNDTKNILETHINYDKIINSHDIKLMGGYSWEENMTGRGFQSANSNFPSDDITFNNLGMGSAPDRVSPDDRYGTTVERTLRMISFYGRANYQFDNRYLLQVSVRRDGSSAFGANHRWGTFPAASIGWKIQNESFMKDQNIFSELRLRASYGVSGNTLGFDPMISYLKYGKQGLTSVNGQDVVAIGITQNANPNLKWESTTTLNVGLDFGLFAGRLSGTLEFYDKYTSDLIWDYSVPTSKYPVGTLIANVGKIQNTGVELQLTGRIIDTKKIRWNSTIVLSHNKNKVISITNDEFSDTYRLTGNVGGSGQSGFRGQIIREGSPIGTFHLPKWAGYDENGISQFYDENGIPTAQPTSKDYYDYEKGTAQPTLLFGWQNSIQFNRFDLGFFFRGVAGNYILNATRSWGMKTVEANQFNILSDAADLPRTDIRSHFNSDRYIESGSYLRLDNITLGYTIDPKIPYMNDIRIFCTINNALVFTGYKGIDPEITLGGLTPGIDNRLFYPKTRTFMFGLTFNIY